MWESLHYLSVVLTLYYELILNNLQKIQKGNSPFELLTRKLTLL